MKIHQLSLFLENKPGQLIIPCKTLAAAGINIVTLSLADTQQYGILRLIVEDWQRAREILEKAGCVVNVTEVVAIEVFDRPGGLADILQALENTGVNIEYMYAFTFGRVNRAILVLRFNDPDKAIATLQGAGFNVIGAVELFKKNIP